LGGLFDFKEVTVVEHIQLDHSRAAFIKNQGVPKE